MKRLRLVERVLGCRRHVREAVAEWPRGAGVFTWAALLALVVRGQSKEQLPSPLRASRQISNSEISEPARRQTTQLRCEGNRDISVRFQHAENAVVLLLW